MRGRDLQEDRRRNDGRAVRTGSLPRPLRSYHLVSYPMLQLSTVAFIAAFLITINVCINAGSFPVFNHERSKVSTLRQVSNPYKAASGNSRLTRRSVSILGTRTIALSKSASASETRGNTHDIQVFSDLTTPGLGTRGYGGPVRFQKSFLGNHALRSHPYR